MSLTRGQLEVVDALGGLVAHKQVIFDGTSAKGAIATAATLSTNLTGANNDLVFTAVATDATGNDITIEYLDPGANDAVLSVDVADSAITVNLATDSGGTITSTAAQVDAAIDAAPAAAALVTPANKGGNDGSGVVTAMAATALSGGKTGYTELFTVTGQVMVALIAVCSEDLAGATATHEVGRAGSTARYMAQETGTGVDNGDTMDLGGLVSSGTAPDVTPKQPAFDGESIIATAGTAAITDGTLDYYMYWYPLSDDGEVAAA